MKTTREKLKVINKYFAFSWQEWDEVMSGGSVKKKSYTKKLIPNPFEMAKQYCLVKACGKKLELPYIAYGVDKWEDDYPDLAEWYISLTPPNPPSKVNFASNPKRFRELVEPLDFSKPYNAKLVDAIRDEFKCVEAKKNIDAGDLIDAELSDENN